MITTNTTIASSTATNESSSSDYVLPEFGLTDKAQLIGKQTKVFIGPDVCLVRELQERQNIFLHKSNVSRFQAIFKHRYEILFTYIQPIKFSCPFFEMIEVEGYTIADIPFEIIPIAAFDSLSPLAENQCVHFTCKKVRKCKTACHKRIRLHQQLLFRFKSNRRIRVDFNLNLDTFLRLKRQIIHIGGSFRKADGHAFESRPDHNRENT